MRYRDFEIRYDPPPIPARNCDWQFWHIDYDGPEDGRSGVAGSWRECVDEINDWFYDEELERFFTIGDGVDGSLVVHGETTIGEAMHGCYRRQFRALVDPKRQRRYTPERGSKRTSALRLI